MIPRSEGNNVNYGEGKHKIRALGFFATDLLQDPLHLKQKQKYPKGRLFPKPMATFL